MREGEVMDGSGAVLPEEAPTRYVGAVECPRCFVWRPAWEDALEIDEDGTVLAWSGVATADCEDCEISLIDYWDGTFAIEWAA